MTLNSRRMMGEIVHNAWDSPKARFQVLHMLTAMDFTSIQLSECVMVRVSMPLS